MNATEALERTQKARGDASKGIKTLSLIIENASLEGKDEASITVPNGPAIETIVNHFAQLGYTVETASSVLHRGQTVISAIWRNAQ